MRRRAAEGVTDTRRRGQTVAERKEGRKTHHETDVSLITPVLLLQCALYDCVIRYPLPFFCPLSSHRPLPTDALHGHVSACCI